MKMLGKIAVMAAVGGVGATILYANPQATTSVALQQAEVVMAKAIEDARHVKQLQQTARKEKDVIKLNCINDKLVQMRPQLNMAEKMKRDIAAGAGSVDAMNEVGEAVRKLREAAVQCVGEPTLGSESSNSYSAPPMYDPTQDDPWGNPLEPPAYASPVN